jgi:polar amino acid transport system substrate-binding protein
MPERHPYVYDIARAVDRKGDYFPGHSDSVAFLMRMMAAQAGIQDTEVLNSLQIFGMIHDAGKLGIPDSILNKPGRLDPDEWKEMKRHSEFGEFVAHSVTGYEHIAPWVRHHHERWDGNGYPDGLKGEDIPWQSRMLLVADAFQVMTSDRVYQRARDRGPALQELVRNRNTQFCPVMVGYLVLRQTVYPLGDALKRVHEGEEPHPAIRAIEQAIEKIDTETGMP